MPRSLLLLLSIISLLLLSPSRLDAWQLAGTSLIAVQIPRDGLPVSPLTNADLDGDDLQEKLHLIDGRLEILSKGISGWKSPETWNVEQGFVADLNRDSLSEAVLLVSRPFMPWPVDAWLPSGGRINGFHDSEGFSSHIILIGWDEGAFQELWAGSALSQPVKRMFVLENPASGPYLATLEGRYDDPPSAPARFLKVWDWNGFGFSLVSSMRGNFTGAVVVQSGKQQVLVLQK